MRLVRLDEAAAEACADVLARLAELLEHAGHHHVPRLDVDGAGPILDLAVVAWQRAVLAQG